MAPMRAPRPALGLLCLLACGSLLVAGCGGGSGSSSQVNPEAESGKSRPAPPTSSFPAPEGRTLEELVKAKVEPKERGQNQDHPGSAGLLPGPEPLPVHARGKGHGHRPARQGDRRRRSGDLLAKVPTVKPGAGSKAGDKAQAGEGEARR